MLAGQFRTQHELNQMSAEDGKAGKLLRPEVFQINTRIIVSSMAVMIPVPALDYWALGPNGCSAIRRRRSQA